MSADARTALLLPQLTLDEKLDLMGGMDGFLHADQLGHRERVPRLDPAALPQRRAGRHQARDRCGLGPGHRAARAAGSAAGFDTKLADTYAGVIAGEANRRGDDVVLGPTVNLVRDPRGGRNFESYGEDPRLLSDFGVAWIRALQGAG